MSRPDLLNLSPDDLADLSNRGTVKRAQRELDANDTPGEVRERPDGTVEIQWRDGVVCVFPGDASIAGATCTCAAPGLCRHLARGVLLYQREASTAPAAESSTPEVWDPGAISDAELAALFPPAELARLRLRAHQGTLVEVRRVVQPTAHFWPAGVTLRFLKPGDPRFTHCGCGQPAPCEHVPVAIWAFRRLPATRDFAEIALEDELLSVPREALEQLDRLWLDWAEHGTAHAPAGWADRCARLADKCADEGLHWHAEILEELIAQHARYAARDAAFVPERVAELIGEALLRADALRHADRPVPALFLRGPRVSRATELGYSRLIGLGCEVRPSSHNDAITLYLTDPRTGAMSTIVQEIGAPAEGAGERLDFRRMGRRAACGNVSFADAGSGALVLQSAKRTPGERLVIGRSRVTREAQAFDWEKLPAPLLAERFADVSARLARRPPAVFLPRLSTGSFVVLAVAEASAARFDTRRHATRAELIDREGTRAELTLPYFGRGARGTEALRRALTEYARDLRFVAGQPRVVHGQLELVPTALLFETGGQRWLLQPWLSASTRGTAAADAELNVAESNMTTDVSTSVTQAMRAQSVRDGGPRSPVPAWIAEITDALHVGMRHRDAVQHTRWRSLAEEASAAGYARVAGLLAACAASQPNEAFVRLLAVARLSQDLPWPPTQDPRAPVVVTKPRPSS